MKTVDLEECWLWAGPKGNEDYGRIWIDGKYRPAHRIIYEALVGEIKEGLEPDHLCRVTACVNPDHIEPVTHAENMRRAMIFKRKTHCKKGHELIADNLKWSYSKERGYATRQCKLCYNALALKYYYILKSKKGVE